MTRNLLLHTAVAALMLAAPAAAQQSERIRSHSLNSNSECLEWSLDFEFDRCARMPMPGEPGTFVQVYTLPDGTPRTLSADPNAAADDVDENLDPRQSMSPVDSVTTALISDDREATSAAIEDAAAGRGGAVGAVDEAPEVQEAAAVDEPEPVSIVEENFILPPIVASIPGRTEIMPMAMGHLNRIETPFTDPMVRSSAAADALSVQFDKNFVYVSVTQPVTLFIHDKGYPDPAIVVSLVPQRIAPRQVRITLPSTAMKEVKSHAATIQANNAPAKPKKAAAAPRANTKGVTRAPEPKQATNTVAHLVQTYSRGQIPRGFMNISLEGFQAGAFCSHAGVKFSFRQGAGIASNEYILVRGMAEANKSIELNELWCAKHPQTLAVAFAPRTKIGPEHPADFYVLIRRPNASIKSARKGN